MKRRRFERLRDLMKESNVTQMDLTTWWNIEHPDSFKYPNWMCAFFTGKRSFPLDIAYWILDNLGVDHSQLSYYFPPRGVDE